MKKIMIPLVLLVVGITSNAQSAKKEPPPPPAKPKNEIVKPESPKVVIDEEVNASKPKEPPIVTASNKTVDDFYKQNPSVSDFSRQGSVIILKKKDGPMEKYDTSKKEEDKSFTEKYGVSPIPPPPPKVIKPKPKA
jgi:hypothetical protein